METYIKKYAKNSLLISILLVAFSLFLIFDPEKSINIVMSILAIILIANGIVRAITYFTTSRDYKLYNFDLVQSIICIISGGVILFKPTIIFTFLQFIVGIWMIIQSIIKIQISLNLRELSSKLWVSNLILSFLTLILGLVIIFNPFATTITLTTICGIMLLISELSTIFEAFCILKSK